MAKSKPETAEAEPSPPKVKVTPPKPKTAPPPPEVKAAPPPKKSPAKPTGPTAVCPECGDVREVSSYYDPKVHEQRCPTCRFASR